MRCTKYLSVVLTLVCLTTIDGLDVSTAVKDLMGNASAVLEEIKCPFFECCGYPWIINNVTGLHLDLQSKLYGQHLVVNSVYSHVKAHVTPHWQPHKALALSFHGWMGTGKNYVAKIIAENLYKKGMRSQFVHLISAIREFPFPDRVDEYKTNIRKMIETSVKKCPQSLFIFHEEKEVPEGLIDAIRPYLQPHDSLGGVNFRKAIFLFLGNVGGDSIARYARDKWRNGIKRESISLKDMEPLIVKSAFSEKNMGFTGSQLIRNNMTTAYIPFLPLERAHVRRCIEDVIQQRGYFETGKIPRNLVDQVLANLHFQPKLEMAFSTSGCKRVPEKVDYVFHSQEL